MDIYWVHFTNRQGPAVFRVWGFSSVTFGQEIEERECYFSWLLEICRSSRKTEPFPEGCPVVLLWYLGGATRSLQTKYFHLS